MRPLLDYEAQEGNRAKETILLETPVAVMVAVLASEDANFDNRRRE